MVTYWCAWCGALDEAETDEAMVPCRRCAREFSRLFGFVPRTLMFPLDPETEPGPPAAATRRFVFRDTSTGLETGATEVAAWRPVRRASGE